LNLQIVGAGLVPARGCRTLREPLKNYTLNTVILRHSRRISSFQQKNEILRCTQDDKNWHFSDIHNIFRYTFEITLSSSWAEIQLFFIRRI